MAEKASVSITYLFMKRYIPCGLAAGSGKGTAEQPWSVGLGGDNR